MPKVPRLRYHEAVTLADVKEREGSELGRLIERAQTEKAELEKVDGSLDILKKEIAKYMVAIAAEEARPADQVDHAQLIRMRKALIGHELRLEVAQQTVAEISEKIDELHACLAKVMKELEEPNRVIQAELRMNADVPPSIYEADDEYQAAVHKREAVIKRVGDHVKIEAVEATERDIQPMLQEIDDFLEKFDKASGRLRLNQYPNFDPDRIDAVVNAFCLLEKDDESDNYGERVLEILEEYNKARANVANSAGGHVAKAVGVLHAAVEELRKIAPIVGQENQPDRLKARRKDFEEAAAMIRDNHQKYIIPQEEKLYVSLSEPGDRDHLVKARLGEESAAALEPAILETLKERSAREEYLKKLLGKLGVPLNLESIDKALDVRKQDATNNKNPNIKESDILDQLRKDILYLLDPTDPQKNGALDAEEVRRRKNRIERLNALGLSMEPLKPEELELVLHSMDGSLDVKTALGELKPKIVIYISKLKSFNDAADLNAEVMTRWVEMFDRFDALLDGSLVQQDIKNNVPPAYRHKGPDHYKKLILDAEGVVAPGAGPGTSGAGGSAPSEKAKIEAEVDGFIASMQHATEIKKETAMLERALSGQSALMAPATEAVQHHAEVKAKHEVLKLVQQAKDEYCEERGIAADPADKPTERKTFADRWTADHTIKASAAEQAEQAAMRARQSAETAFATAAQATDYLQAQQQLEQLEEIISLARDGRVGALLKMDKQRLKPLESATGIRVRGQEYTGASLLEDIQRSASLAPFVRVRTWMPPAVRRQTLKHLLGSTHVPEEAIAAAYDGAILAAQPTRDLINWTIAHWDKKPVPRWYNAKEPAITAWKAELVPKADELCTRLNDVIVGLKDERRRRPDETNDEAYHRRDHPLEPREENAKMAIDSLTEAIHRPDGVEADAMLAALFKGLSVLTREATGLEPYFSTGEPEGSVARVKKLQTMLATIARNPATDRELLQVVAEERRRLEDLAGAFPRVADALEASRALNVAGKRTALEAKERHIDDLNRVVGEKQTAYEAADQALRVAEREKLDDALAGFDQATNIHLETVIDPNHLLGHKEAEITQAWEAAKKRRGDMHVEVGKFLDGCAAAYGAWLDKRGTVMTPTAAPTESEKRNLSEAQAAEDKLFALFKAHGAPEKGPAAAFKAWWDGLDDAKLRDIGDAVVQGLFKKVS